MAKNRDTNKVREEERQVETDAAYAGKGMDDEGGSNYSMPGTEKDSSLSMAQSAADAAASFNAGSEENAGSGTEAVEDYD